MELGLGPGDGVVGLCHVVWRWLGGDAWWRGKFGASREFVGCTAEGLGGNVLHPVVKAVLNAVGHIPVLWS